MENKKSTGAIVAIVGGVALVIGAFLTWGTVTLDLAKFATALGIDPSLFSGSIQGTSQSVSGTDGWEGKVAIAAGIVAIGVAIFAMREARKGLSILLIVAGIVGGGVALYDVVTVNDQKDAAIEDLTPQLQAAGIPPSTLSDATDVSLAAGIWICLIAGIVVIAGGVLVRSGEGETSAAGTSMGMGSDLGLSSPPATPAATMTAAAAMTPSPPAMPSTVPSPPAGGSSDEPSSEGEADGGT